MMDPYLENLEEEVMVKNNTVTYKWLVKYVKVSSNVAKQMLYEFMERQRAAKVDVSATYLVSGERKLEDNSMVHEIFIVPESQLETVKSKLTSVSGVHIYAVHKAPLQDPSVLYSTDYHLFHENSNDDTTRVYSICYPKLSFRQTTKKEVEVKSEPQVVSRVKASVVDSTVTTTTKKTDKVSGSQKSANGALEKMFVNMSKKEKTEKKPPLPVVEVQAPIKLAENKSTHNITSTSESSNSSKKKNGGPMKRNYEERKTYIVTENHTRKRRRIIQVSDSSDEDNDEDMEDVERVKLIPSEAECDNPEDPLPPPSPKPNSFKDKPAFQNQVRHKRTLVEETSTDKEGYLVTEKVWKDVMENEIVKENKPLPVKKEIVEEKPTFRQKQSTLMNFFKKK